MAGLKSQGVDDLCTLADVVVANCRASESNPLLNLYTALKTAVLDVANIKIFSNIYTMPMLGTTACGLQS